MTWLLWFAAGEALIILALAAWAGHLLTQLDSERQRIALLRRLR